MTLSVGVIYGVIGCLILYETNAQHFGSYYNQEEYFKQSPHHTESNSNAYHGYSTTPVNSKANSVQIIEVSIPDFQLSGGKFGASKSDEAIVSSVINQVIQGQTGASTPYTFSIHTYSDKNSPHINSQSQYQAYQAANYYKQQKFQQPNSYQQPSSYQQPNSYQQPSNYQQPNSYQQTNYYPQQQQNSNDRYFQQQQQQQYQRDLEEYEKQLKEYYDKYPTTTLSPQVSEFNKPNEIIPTRPDTIVDSVKEPQNGPNSGGTTNHSDNGLSDGKSLLELLNEENGQTEGKSLAELLGQQSASTESPKKSLDDLIGNVFTEKQNHPTEAPSQEVGKSLFELLSELESPEETPKDTVTKDSDKPIPQEKKNSDVAGGDYGLDVRADDSKVKRTKRSILREGLRRIKERIISFGSNDNERHTRDHDCKHHEGRSHHSSYHNHRHQHDEDEFIEDHKQDWHKEKRPYDSYGHDHGHPHPHAHPHPHSHPNYNIEDENIKPNQNEKPRPFSEGSQHDETTTPTRKPHSVDAGTQTDAVIATKTEPDKDPTLDIDIRGGFGETRRKRHAKRSRRSPEEEVVFQDDDETTLKTEDKKEEDAKVEKDEEKITDTDAVKSNSTEAEGEEGEKGELDSRFGFFGGGGFNRQAGRRPIGSIIGGVVNGVLGGVVNGFAGNYDPYNRAPPPEPTYYPDPHQSYHPPDYAQQQLYGYGNYPPPPQQPPVHIHINNVANAQSQATNTAGPAGPFNPHGSNQNAAANAQSQNYQNQFGSFQNSGASGQASNLAADGSSGQLSAANAMNQNYQNEFGAGSKNAAQSQSANFDAHGNLALTSSNSGTNHFAGPDGVRDESNSAAQSSLQGQFGTQNSGAQSNTYQGPNGSGSSASSQSSSINNGHGSQNSGAQAAANSGNIGGNSFGNAQSGTYANDQWGW